MLVINQPSTSFLPRRSRVPKSTKRLLKALLKILRVQVGLQRVLRTQHLKPQSQNSAAGNLCVRSTQGTATLKIDLRIAGVDSSDEVITTLAS